MRCDRDPFDHAVARYLDRTVGDNIDAQGKLVAKGGGQGECGLAPGSVVEVQQLPDVGKIVARLAASGSRNRASAKGRTGAGTSLEMKH